jgi:hypothetical protein
VTFSLCTVRSLRRLASALIVSAAALAAPVAADAGACSNSGVPGTPYEGFGARTPGGAGKRIYRVTTLADSGPGSLREAVSDGDRCIVFDVAGTIVLRKQIYVHGAYVTIDGFSAPSPGITLRDYGLSLWGSGGAHDVIVRGLRIRNAGDRTCTAAQDEGDCWDGLQIKNGATRVVVDHVSIDNASDGAFDVASSSDVTIQWSILSGTTKQSLLDRATRVSMHHNLLINGHSRNAQTQWDDTQRTTPPAVALDFRNNLVWNFSAYGTIVQKNATANVVNNYYHSASRPSASDTLAVDRGGRAYAAGNRAGNGGDVDGEGTVRSAFSTASVSTSDACRAAAEVRSEAGARGGDFGPDAIDRGHLDDLPSRLPGCASGTLPSAGPSQPSTSGGGGARPDLTVSSFAVPTTLQRGQEFPIHFGITNRGTASAGGSRIKIYLSSDTGVSSSDVLLRSRSISPLVPGASQSHSVPEVIPTGVKAGAYYLLVVLDVDGAVSESTESNNIKATRVTVR